MLKKSVTTLFVGVLLASTSFIASAHATSITNGAACAKAGATTTVKVKGVSKAYVCKLNPALASATKQTWTLKTCLTYWSAAQGQQASIDQQLPLISIMNEPDKTTYTNQLKDAQTQLDKVKATIISNYCKLGL
jgi:hypothetical protein